MVKGWPDIPKEALKPILDAIPARYDKVFNSREFRTLPSRYWPHAAFRACNCPDDLERRRRRRVDEIVERCAGTAQGYEQELDEWEENDVALLEMLDDELFTCEDCGWCCADDTRSDCGDGDFCDECRPRD